MILKLIYNHKYKDMTKDIEKNNNKANDKMKEIKEIKEEIKEIKKVKENKVKEMKETKKQTKKLKDTKESNMKENKENKENKEVIIKPEDETIKTELNSNQPLMRKATALWLLENTSISFKQIAEFCNIHPLEIQAIADGESSVKVTPLNPIDSKQLTREMITAALSACIPVFHTEGNRNSQLGVPLTLADMCDSPSEAAVIEMGISDPGGMDKLTRMVMPDIAVCTMIGVAHIEFMKTQEGIRSEKLRITGRMDENGLLFLNADDKLLWDMKGKTDVKTFFYGTNPEADYRAENIRYENGYNTYDY